MTNEFRDKIALVGGGGSGIGRATATLLASMGAAIVVAGRRGEMLDQVVEEIVAGGGHALAHAADLASADGARAAVDAAVQAFGGVDFAVNAAGSAGVGTIVETDEALFDKLIGDNVRSTWLGMKFQLPAIGTRGGGAIVNVSSRSGLVGTAHGAVYSAAKHAVIGLTKSAALEAASSRVRVNAVCPGQTRTAQFERIVAEAMPGATSDEAAAMLAGKVPLGRIAAPRDVASAICWLLSSDAGFVTGVALPVDGGSGAG